MKQLFYLLLLCPACFSVQAQTTITVKELNEKLSALPLAVEETKFKNLANLILNDPRIYNGIWNKVYNSIRDKKDQPLLKNLKIDFKTFTASDSSKASLGFSYAWNYEINKKKQEDYERSEFIAKLNLAGNVAFKKALNPQDFQSAKLEIGANGFLGGTVKKQPAAVTDELNKINQQLTAIEDESELASSPLWGQLTQAMGISNQYHYNFSAVGGWEGSQDFSRSQLTGGAQLRFSAKSYSDKNPLSMLNLLDYPFTLIRYLTGTDKNLGAYGATLPVITLGIDLVKPTRDTLRKKLTGETEQYARFRFEAGFRTLLAEAGNTTFHFNAAYRFFTELNAPAPVKSAGLHRSSFFTCSVTGADTYFISYSYGRLPFDRSDNAIYEMGFRFKF